MVLSKENRKSSTFTHFLTAQEFKKLKKLAEAF